MYSSFIPGPLLPAGFQYANTKGKIWEILSCVAMLGSIRQEGGRHIGGSVRS